MRFVLCAWLALVVADSARAQTPDKDGWFELFDGKTLDGWKAGEDIGAFKVVDGVIVAGATKLTHLYYVGPVNKGVFRNFELKAQVLTKPKGNSGIFFHTEYVAKGIPKGFEFQINNTGSDKQYRTGAIYPAKPLDKPFAEDDKWFECHLTVNGGHVVLKVDGKTTLDVMLPVDAKAGRTLGSGTIAIQSHDPGSIVHFRSIRIKPTE